MRGPGPGRQRGLPRRGRGGCAACRGAARPAVGRGGWAACEPSGWAAIPCGVPAVRIRAAKLRAAAPRNAVGCAQPGATVLFSADKRKQAPP